MSDKAARSYHSPLRQEQAEQTRERIVDALTEQVFEQGLADFSIPKVAKRAGVATRTLYRYFPTRDDLLAAVWERFQRDMKPPDAPTRVEELPGAVRQLFRFFDDNRETLEAIRVTALAREMAERDRAERYSRIRSIDWPELDHLSERERLKVVGMVRAAMSSDTWRMLTERIGLTTDEAADAAEHTVRLILNDLLSKRSPRGDG